MRKKRRGLVGRLPHAPPRRLVLVIPWLDDISSVAATVGDIDNLITGESFPRKRSMRRIRLCNGLKGRASDTASASFQRVPADIPGARHPLAAGRMGLGGDAFGFSIRCIIGGLCGPQIRRNGSNLIDGRLVKKDFSAAQLGNGSAPPLSDGMQAISRADPAAITPEGFSLGDLSTTIRISRQTSPNYWWATFSGPR